MSQSDFIKYKRTQVVLKTQSKLPAILSEKAYVNYEGYAIETTISNTKTIPNQLQQSGYTTVFGMERKTTNCPTFIMCNGTDARPNRQLFGGPRTYVDPTNVQPFYVPNTKSCPLYIKCKAPDLRSNIYTPTTL